MISRYRMALMQVVDLCCILLALAVSGMVTIAPDLSVFDDYTGASLFTIFFYLLFFYILDAYSVGMEDFKDTLGRILVACVLGIISSATASTSSSRPFGRKIPISTCVACRVTRRCAWRRPLWWNGRVPLRSRRISKRCP